MKIKLIKNIDIKNNDLNILEVINNIIIINNNYKGYQIFDKEFKLIKSIDLKWPNGSLQEIYKYFAHNSLLIHTEDFTRLLFIDIDNNKTHIFLFKGKLKNVIFNRCYYWKDNSIILQRKYANDTFVIINTLTNKYKIVSEKYIQKNYSKYFDLSKVSKQYWIIRFIDQYRFIFSDDDKKIVGTFDFEKQEEIVYPQLIDNAFNFEINNDVVLQIAQKKILIYKNKEFAELISGDKFRFGNVKFLEDNKFLVQFWAENGSYHSIIRYYLIED